MAKLEKPVDRPDLVSHLGLMGAGIGGVAGGLAGLVVGVFVYAPTAWFAVIELGLPAAVVGGVGGVITGLVVKATHRVSE
jgi:hypothetical protein